MAQRLASAPGYTVHSSEHCLAHGYGFLPLWEARNLQKSYSGLLKPVRSWSLMWNPNQRISVLLLFPRDGLTLFVTGRVTCSLCRKLLFSTVHLLYTCLILKQNTKQKEIQLLCDFDLDHWWVGQTDQATMLQLHRKSQPWKSKQGCIHWQSAPHKRELLLEIAHSKSFSDCIAIFRSKLSFILAHKFENMSCVISCAESH